MTRTGERWRRVGALATTAAACSLLAAAGCKRPVVGEPAKPALEAGGPSIALTGASIDATGHVIATFTLSDGDAPVPTADAALALKPRFTLAALSRHPVEPLAAWKSLLLTGTHLPRLAPSGPGTPAAAVLTDTRQPGTDVGGTLSGEDGTFRYVFGTALPTGFDPQETVRVGVWLLGNGTARGTSTLDFRPAGGAPAPRDATLDANCSKCHGSLLCSPRGAVGVKMCITCHTWQNADPDTADPAALDGATGATDPNPLDFGRMIHRIHRGKNLPTLYASSSTAAAPALPSATALPLPFFPGRNLPIAGRKYSIVGPLSQEVVFGKVVTRTDNGRPGKVLAAGVVFPRDLRDCEACHAGAPQEYEVLYAISRRTCAGCHPEIWFEPTPITDPVHFAHPGGPQADDTQCAGCHVSATATQPKLYAPLAALHAPPYRSARYAMPTVEIVSVENLRAGQAPTIRFKLFDEVGPLSPPNAPTPTTDPSPSGSPVPRALERLYFVVAGPTAPDYAGTPISSADVGNPSPLTLVADAQGVFTYTFVSTLPDDAKGTWAIGAEARRRVAVPLYDTTTDTFPWPYTGETVTETARNTVVYVDAAAGTWPSGGAPLRRRAVTPQEKCDRCHGRIVLHGSLRNQVEYCLLCHVPDRTDWTQRPKSGGNVDLAATYDGLEERTVHMKVMIHRLHTGGRDGAAALDGIAPHVIYGYGGNPYFFDEGGFPNDLQDCTLCHEGRTYLVESVPADAPPTLANETATIRHQATAAHVTGEGGETATPPIQAACLGCHATGATLNHVGRKTVGGVEQCASCHVRGALSVDVAHGLASPDRAAVAATWSAIVEDVIVPRCASAACHGGSPPPAFPQLDAEVAYEAMFEVPSQQASGVNLVEPYEPARSYLVLKIRGEAGSVGGVATPMPIGDALLEPSEIAAIEAWIANGAPND